MTDARTLPAGWTGRATRRGPPTAADYRVQTRRGHDTPAVLATVESVPGGCRWYVAVQRGSRVQIVGSGRIDCTRGRLRVGAEHCEREIPAVVRAVQQGLL